MNSTYRDTPAGHMRGILFCTRRTPGCAAALETMCPVEGDGLSIGATFQAVEPSDRISQTE